MSNICRSKITSFNTYYLDTHTHAHIKLTALPGPLNLIRAGVYKHNRCSPTWQQTKAKTDTKL